MDTTEIIARVRAGDQEARDDLFEHTYQTLRDIAQLERNRWHGNNTLNATSLVQETYLKLVSSASLSVNDRAHFLALVSRAMRQVLMDYAEKTSTGKRGGQSDKIPLDRLGEVGAGSPETSLADVIDITTALNKLEEQYPELTAIVECRFYGGMTIEETAAALGIGTTTVSRRWAVAQALLYQLIRTKGTAAPG